MVENVLYVEQIYILKIKFIKITENASTDIA